MAASYPTSVKSFTTKVDGVDYPQAAHINDLQLEVTAIETKLVAGRYVMQTGFQNTSPADATNYYFGSWENLTFNTTANERKMYILQAGKIVGADVLFRQTAGSAQTSTLYIRHNNTTDYTISAAITNDAAETHFSNTSLNSGSGITVAVGDSIELKWLTPTWSPTNPTGVYCQVRLLVA